MTVIDIKTARESNPISGETLENHATGRKDDIGNFGKMEIWGIGDNEKSQKTELGLSVCVVLVMVE